MKSVHGGTNFICDQCDKELKVILKDICSQFMKEYILIVIRVKEEISLVINEITRQQKGITVKYINAITSSRKTFFL